MFQLIHLTLDPVVEVDHIAVDTWETYLVAFNTPGHNTNQRCSAIDVANKWTTRVTLACIFTGWGYWFTTLIQRRFICMRNTSTYLILIYPETIIRKFAFITLFSARPTISPPTKLQSLSGNKVFLWLRQYVLDIKLTPADCNLDGVLPFHCVNPQPAIQHWAPWCALRSIEGVARHGTLLSLRDKSATTVITQIS